MSMKNSKIISLFLLIAAAALLLTACGAGKTSSGSALSGKASSKDGPVVLRLNNMEFTESQILAMMSFTTRTYNLSLDDVREDTQIWNSLVDGTVYDYAAAEISRDLCTAYGLLEMTDEEKESVENYYQSFLNTIEQIGESKEDFLQQLGLTEETLMRYSEDQVYKDHLSKYWADQMDDISSDEKKAEYEALLNFTKLIWEEIDSRIENGSYLINEESLLLKIK